MILNTEKHMTTDIVVKLQEEDPALHFVKGRMFSDKSTEWRTLWFLCYMASCIFCVCLINCKKERKNKAVSEMVFVTVIMQVIAGTNL